MPALAHVRAADLRLDPGVDPRAVGAAVTTRLCGHWEHEGRCRWPHHNAIAPTDDGFALRVVYVAPDEDVVEVESRIDAALHTMEGCDVVVSGRDALRADERPLATRLASS
jgi:hypothetical protein